MQAAMISVTALLAAAAVVRAARRGDGAPEGGLDTVSSAPLGVAARGRDGATTPVLTRTTD
jgi:hypothetical protein